MGLFSGLGANTLSKFTSMINRYTTYGNSIVNGSVSMFLPDGSSGVSHATDLKRKMASIEWSRGYSWDVHLSPSPPAPFDDSAYGIPVVEVDCQYALMGESGDLPQANSTYRYPHRKNFFDIKLTMLDDEKGTMEQYFEEWMNHVYSWDDDPSLRGTINYLDKSVRQLTLSKLDSKKKEIFNRQYLVYPEANLSSFNNSTGSVRTFTINLVIAGYMGKNYTPSVGSNLGGDSITGFNKAETLTEQIRMATTPISIHDDSWQSYASSSALDVRDTRSATQKALETVVSRPNLPDSIF